MSQKTAALQMPVESAEGASSASLTAPTSPFLQTAEAAAYLRLTPVTLEKFRCAGGGPPFYRVGPKRIVYDPTDLDSWVRANKFASTSERIAPDAAA